MKLTLTIENDDGVIDEWTVADFHDDDTDEAPNLTELRDMAELMLAATGL